MEEKRAQPHIVLFPFMAQGHITPFLSLAKLIQRRHPAAAVTLVNTPLNIRTLRSSLPADSSLRLHSLPYDSSLHGLPPDSEHTHSLSRDERLRFYFSSASLRPHFIRFLSSLPPPVCVVADFFFGWTAAVARDLRASHATFTTCGAYGTAGYFSAWLHLPHNRTTADEFGLPGFPDGYCLHRSQLPSYMLAATADDPWAVFFRREISAALGSDALLCNTAEELEPEGLRVMRSNAGGLRVWAIGPLLPPETDSGGGSEYARWLAAHPPASVLYVSFGSQNTISAAQMMALAAGLEASGVPFVWVVRPPLGSDLAAEFRDEWLPEGFEARMRECGRGLLVKGWAPQLEILSHGSTAAFLSHCGWNSVAESLSRGVPVIGWPLGAEQFFNSKMMVEELGVCVELARGVGDGLEWGEVERVVRAVVGGEKGPEMREKAARLRDVIRAAVREDGDEKGSSSTAIDDFIRTAFSDKTSSVDIEA